MLKILTYPNKILDEQVPEFDFENPIMDPKELEKEMLAAMFASNGIGLAAPQVGIKTRVFVMGHALMPDNSFALFNPEVVNSSTELREVDEGCLSFPNIFAKIKRPSWIEVKYKTSNGEEQINRFEGYDCVCFLHELDHLDGIVFKDRLSSLKWALSVKKSKKVKKYA
jgi:peptide deformylase